MADASTDARIQAYKANKLIPQNVVIPTSTGATDSSKVVVFNSSGLTWSTQSVDTGPYAAQKGINKAEWDAMLGAKVQTSGGTGEYDYKTWALEFSQYTQSDLDYLNAVASGEVTSPNLTASEAREILSANLDVISSISPSFESTYDTHMYTQYTGDVTHMDISNVECSPIYVMSALAATHPNTKEITLTQAQADFILMYEGYPTLDDYKPGYTWNIK